MIRCELQRTFLQTLLMVCCLWAGGLGTTSVAVAEDNEPWEVHRKVLGEPKDSGDVEAEKSNDVSGLACATTHSFPRVCLIVDDESQGAQIVILDDGKLIAGQFIRLIYDSHDEKPLELDAEGVTYADGFFYVIGSHGRPRHEADTGKEAKNKAKAQASKRAFRIRFDIDAVDSKTAKLSGPVEIKPSTGLGPLIKAQAELGKSFDKPLDDNGLTIEGVAVRNGLLYAGMRAPILDDGKAAILSVPLSVLFDGRAGAAKLHRVSLGKDRLDKPRGIRDIVVYGNRFLIVAGPAKDPPEDLEIKTGDYSIYSYNGKAATKLLDLKAYGKGKPEGLVPLDKKSGKLRALLLFDGPEEGKPRPIELD